MKNTLIILTLLVVVSGFSACAERKFDGSKTGDNENFTVSYSILNTTLTHEMELEAGAVIDVEISDQSGRVDVLVTDENGGVVYKCDEAPTSSFKLEIDKAGVYTFSVTGKRARGGVSFVVE
jgi:hypothetical protein